MHQATGEIAPKKEDTASSTAVAAVAVDLLMMVLAPWLLGMLSTAYDQAHWMVGLIPLTAFIGFCAVLRLVRRLPGETGGMQTSRWVFLSVMVGTGVLLFAIPWVMGQGALPLAHFLTGTIIGRILLVPLGLLACVAIFLPLGLLVAGEPRPLRNHLGVAELSILLVSDFVALVGASLFEFSMRTAPLHGEPHPMFYVGLLIMVPLFLLVYGGPRLLLLQRRFSWLAAGSLVVSTAWYLAVDVVVR